MHSHRLCLPQGARRDYDYEPVANRKQGWSAGKGEGWLVPYRSRRSAPYHRCKKMTRGHGKRRKLELA